MTNPEVLIYLDRIKTFFKTNDEARDYFINDGDEIKFYEHLLEISEKNYKTEGAPELTREQLELLRVTLIAERITKQNYFYSEDGLFLFYEEYDPVCMN
jgi:hypothetical protein